MAGGYRDWFKRAKSEEMKNDEEEWEFVVEAAKDFRGPLRYGVSK
jgi:hypothetical protein